MKTKQELRQEIRRKKKSMTSTEIHEKSRKIFEQLEQLSVWKDTDCIFAYVSYNQEVETRARLGTWIKDGKRVALPKVVGEEMKFYFIDDIQQLERGYQGILEPNSTVCADGASGIMLMPGLAFDQNYHRLGYGGGFYDRYLNSHREAEFYKIALAYQFQVVEEVPTEAFDHPVDRIITEECTFLYR